MTPSRPHNYSEKMRRPYLSMRVLEGLETMIARTRPETESELVAEKWIRDRNLWRTLYGSSPHDAEVSPTTERGAFIASRSAGDEQIPEAL